MCESVVPAETCTGLCTSAFGDGVQTVTDGLLVLKVQGEVASALPDIIEVETKTRAISRPKALDFREFIRAPVRDDEISTELLQTKTGYPATGLLDLRFAYSASNREFQVRQGQTSGQAQGVDNSAVTNGFSKGFSL